MITLGFVISIRIILCTYATCISLQIALFFVAVIILLLLHDYLPPSSQSCLLFMLPLLVYLGVALTYFPRCVCMWRKRKVSKYRKVEMFRLLNCISTVSCVRQWCYWIQAIVCAYFVVSLRYCKFIYKSVCVYVCLYVCMFTVMSV